MDPDDLALALLARSEPATSAGMAGHVPITARGFGVVGSGPRPNSFGMHAASGMRGGAPQQPGAAGSLQPAGMPSTLPASRPMMPPGAPVALPPHGQALAAWPGAQAAGAVAQTAAAPLAQAAAAMLRMSPDQAMVVVRFSLKASTGWGRAGSGVVYSVLP